VPKPKDKGKEFVLTLRVPEEWNERAKSLAKKMSTPGFRMTKSQLLRQMIVLGLTDLEKGHGKKT
jgi:hypothetical protein